MLCVEATVCFHAEVLLKIFKTIDIACVRACVCEWERLSPDSNGSPCGMRSLSSAQCCFTAWNYIGSTLQKDSAILFLSMNFAVIGYAI